MKKTIGGDRLGSGKKMQVDLHGYERSTHDLGYLWRSTMSAGTLVPFLSELALPGDTFDIHLACEMMTHPTLGPLFGSYKVQLDVFQAPIRLYQGQLHNNKLGIGNNMANVKLPIITLEVDPTIAVDTTDLDNQQINPSCILSYLGIRGVGIADAGETGQQQRDFNGIPYLAYLDIYKNYYANKQEEIGYVIHSPLTAIVQTITAVTIDGTAIPQVPTVGGGENVDGISNVMQITYSGAVPKLEQIILITSNGAQYTADTIAVQSSIITTGTTITFTIDWYTTGTIFIQNWNYIDGGTTAAQPPIPTSFPLENLDKLREGILVYAASTAPFNVTDFTLTPTTLLLNWENGRSPYTATQEGLLLKTYQSDLFNNWLSTEWIDGAGGINEITAIDTSGGSFNIDTLNLSKKVYDMLNRIAISGGSYDDWLDAVYTNERWSRSETPIYHGGLIRELVFQEVVSNSEAWGAEGTKPLGSLAGKGIMSGKRKGGEVTIKVDEPSYIIGIVSLTPRLDYSQGNKWDIHLKTMDDFHKPALDEIGFQEDITEQRAWWSTTQVGGEWIQKSAGKQPAWINYMTNVNQTRGNFAINTNEMFMTLNRRYEHIGGEIGDLTTYIDPSKYNFIFAQTALDSQNFWAQIAVDITARRKMSAKIMPNL